MTRFVLAVALAIYNLLALSTGVGATCEACPNCDYEQISPTQGNACLNYWTCSGDTISCFYPSVANPGTYRECSYSASAVSALSYSDTCSLTNNVWGYFRIGHSQVAPAISVSVMREITPSVNLQTILTTMDCLAAPLRTDTLVNIIVHC